MLRSNYVGLGMFVVGGLLAGLFSLVFKLSDATVFIIVGGCLLLMDLLLRLRNRFHMRWLVNGQAGGFLISIPVWIIGFVVLGINLVRAVVV